MWMSESVKLAPGASLKVKVTVEVLSLSLSKSSAMATVTVLGVHTLQEHIESGRGADVSIAVNRGNVEMQWLIRGDHRGSKRKFSSLTLLVPVISVIQTWILSN